MTFFKKFTIVVTIVAFTLFALQQIEIFFRFSKPERMLLTVPLLALDVLFLSRALFNTPIRAESLRMLGYFVTTLTVILIIPFTAVMVIMAGGAVANSGATAVATYGYMIGVALFGLVTILGLFYACRFHHCATLEKVL